MPEDPAAISQTMPPARRLEAAARYLLCALLIFTPLARASVQGWAVTTIHLVTLIALTAFLLDRSLHGNWRWIKTPLDWPIAAMLMVCMLASTFSLHRTNSFWAFVCLLNDVIVFYLVIHIFRTRSDVRRLIWLIIGIGVFLSMFGLFKKYVGNPFPWWDYTDIPETSRHLISTFGNRNHLAGYLEMAVPLGLGLTLVGYQGWKLGLLAGMTVLMGLVLLLTLSRGGWASAFVGLAFMAAVLIASPHFSRKKLVVSLFGVGLALILIALSSTPVVERLLTLEQPLGSRGATAGRAAVWSGVLRMIQDYPLTGIGPGNFANVFEQYHPPADNRQLFAHNDYLQSVAVAGVLTIPIMIWMAVATYRRGFNKFKNDSRLVRGTTLGALSGVTAILVHSMFDFNLRIPANALLFTVLVALVVSPVPLGNSKNAGHPGPDNGPYQPIPPKKEATT